MDREERRGALLKGAAALVGGLVAVVGLFVGLVVLERPSGGLWRLAFGPGVYGVAYGAWTIVRTLRPERPPVVEQSTCWECSARIVSAADGTLCATCGRPLHLRCRGSHAKLAH